MARIQEIKKELEQTSTLVNLTGVFEGIASLRISQIRNQVVQSQDFFSELWKIYSNIRVDQAFHFGRRLSQDQISNKELFVVITGEAGFSGDIDEKLIRWMLTKYDPKKHDIVVIGRHGAIQLVQRGVSIVRYYKMPQKDQNINPVPIIEEIIKYKASTAFYQTYVSLTVQDVKKINLMRAVQDQGATAAEDKQAITEANYIFEPSTYAVVDYLEQQMLGTMIGQIILESKLAQYASRFKAMSTASERGKESVAALKKQYSQTRRRASDAQLREILNSLRGKRL